MQTQRRHDRKWFWAWLILFTVPKESRKSPSVRGEIWKNLVLIEAGSADEALLKAASIGTAEQGDCRGTLRLFGKPAWTEFLGVADMGLIHDELASGAEIIWQLSWGGRKKAKSLIKRKSDLAGRLKKEMRGDL